MKDSVKGAFIVCGRPNVHPFLWTLRGYYFRRLSKNVAILVPLKLAGSQYTAERIEQDGPYPRLLAPGSMKALGKGQIRYSLQDDEQRVHEATVIGQAELLGEPFRERLAAGLVDLASGVEVGLHKSRRGTWLNEQVGER